MANTPKLHRNGAVGFIVWLDFGARLINKPVVERTLAVKRLTATYRTPLNITSEDVQLAFHNATIVTRLPICSPVVFLLAVSDALINFATDSERCWNAFFCHAAVNLTRYRWNFSVIFYRIIQSNPADCWGGVRKMRSHLEIHFSGKCIVMRA